VELLSMNKNAGAQPTIFSTISIAERAKPPKTRILLSIFF
jgi:hypothetical protein